MIYTVNHIISLFLKWSTLNDNFMDNVNVTLWKVSDNVQEIQTVIDNLQTFLINVFRSRKLW